MNLEKKKRQNSPSERDFCATTFLENTASLDPFPSAVSSVLLSSSADWDSYIEQSRGFRFSLFIEAVEQAIYTFIHLNEVTKKLVSGPQYRLFRFGYRVLSIAFVFTVFVFVFVDFFFFLSVSASRKTNLCTPLYHPFSLSLSLLSLPIIINVAVAAKA